ncbi:hypothetical protein QFC24_001942 [Naganishia onofrii]|uniref:Uncharacterized protein n=1 Tax=Naganishia onofrii TaxID=1851511 RepID=A0ACC2XQ88_9TREE|nr:hypothetical protein QFC24_001942 [Naganishia onofrii]
MALDIRKILSAELMPSSATDEQLSLTEAARDWWLWADLTIKQIEKYQETMTTPRAIMSSHSMLYPAPPPLSSHFAVTERHNATGLREESGNASNRIGHQLPVDFDRAMQRILP